MSTSVVFFQQQCPKSNFEPCVSDKEVDKRVKACCAAANAGGCNELCTYELTRDLVKCLLYKRKEGHLACVRACTCVLSCCRYRK